MVTLDEIDCLKGQYRTLALRLTYWDGTTGRTDKPTRWMKVLRSSGEGYLKGQYCQWKAVSRDLRTPTRPARPIPRSTMVAGSGTPEGSTSDFTFTSNMSVSPGMFGYA